MMYPYSEVRLDVGFRSARPNCPPCERTRTARVAAPRTRDLFLPQRSRRTGSLLGPHTFRKHACQPTSLAPGLDLEIAIRDIEPGQQIIDDYGSLNLAVALARPLLGARGKPGSSRRPPSVRRIPPPIHPDRR